MIRVIFKDLLSGFVSAMVPFKRYFCEDVKYLCNIVNGLKLSFSKKNVGSPPPPPRKKKGKINN
jgi:hypothetical protein